MPTESTLAVTAGAGTLLQTSTYSVGGNTVHDEHVVQGEFPYPTYTVQASAISIATANDHVLQIMAGASLNVRLRSVLIEQVTSATAVALCSFELMRLTTAGTGGTVVTPQKHDTADAAAGCTAMTLPTAKGTEAAAAIRRSTLIMRQAFLATAAQPEESILWVPGATSPLSVKPWIIPAGVANGIAVKVLNAIAGATVNVTVEVVETSFV